MAGVLILVRLKLTLLRRSMTGSRGAWMVAGAVVGTGLAVSTIALSALYRASPVILGDLLGVIYALWLAGWIVGPVWGGAPLVRAEHLALIPVPRRRLAVGLLGAAFAGTTTAVTLLAFISLVTFGARLGVLPALVAVPAVILQLVLVVLLSRLMVTVFGQVARSRTGSAVVGVLVAGLLIVSQSGWVLAIAVRTSGLLSTGVTPAFATLVRALPSGWGLYAVEAAGRSDWLTAVGVLVGLAAAIALLLLVWSWKLGSPRAARATIRGARRVRIRRTGPLSGPVGGVVHGCAGRRTSSPTRTAPKLRPPGSRRSVIPGSTAIRRLRRPNNRRTNPGWTTRTHDGTAPCNYPGARASSQFRHCSREALEGCRPVSGRRSRHTTTRCPLCRTVKGHALQGRCAQERERSTGPG